MMVRNEDAYFKEKEGLGMMKFPVFY